MEVLELLNVTAIIAAIVIIVMIIVRSRVRRSEMVHQERMLMIEKGVELPMPSAAPKPRNPFFWPSVLVGLGLAWMITNLLSNFLDVTWGLIPLFVGIAMYAAHILYMKQERLEKNSEKQE